MDQHLKSEKVIQLARIFLSVVRDDHCSVIEYMFSKASCIAQCFSMLSSSSDGMFSSKDSSLSHQYNF